jgi:phosphoglycolate phosphatase
MQERAIAWPQAVIFDLDGTLVDTVGDLAAALNRTLVELDLAPHPPEAVRGMVGGGLAKLLERAVAAHAARFDAARMDAAASRLLEHYATAPAMLSRPYPGAAETLRDLHRAGIACGLCTNKPDAISRDLLQALGLAGAFGCILGAGAELPKKPDPAGLHRVLADLDVEPSRAIMVGDSHTDVKTARAAGLGGMILVSYGYSVTPVTELGADKVIDSLAELPLALAALARDMLP